MQTTCKRLQNQFHPERVFQKDHRYEKKVNMLSDNQIEPGGFYPRSKIEKAIQKKFDTTGFGVKCFWKKGKKKLTEIKICTNRTYVIPCKWFETQE